MTRFWQQVADIFAVLDGVERRADVARYARFAALIALAIIFAFDLLPMMGFSRPYEVAQYAQDEYWFMGDILRLQNYILNAEWANLQLYGHPFAYGLPFWLFAAVVSMPLHGHGMLTVLFLRLLFTAMKYAAFYIVYRRTEKLTQKPLLALFTLLALLLVPAFVFDGKIIGPEYPMMFLAALGFSALFSPRRAAQIGAGFCFGAMTAIKFTGGIFGIAFLAALAAARGRRALLLRDWAAGAALPIICYFIPADPFKEIREFSAAHNFRLDPAFLGKWYGYDANEFDNVLKGGWSVDFVPPVLFLILCGFMAWRMRRPAAAGWTKLTAAIVGGIFLASLATCVFVSFGSLMHPWFGFVPFMLLLASGLAAMGAGRGGTMCALLFLLAYALTLGPRYVERWQHRVDKFEWLAATEDANFPVANWIAEHCPAARGAALDYNLLFPASYNGNMKKVWTIIEIVDYDRHGGDAMDVLKSIDLLLVKAERVASFPPLPMRATRRAVPPRVLGDFFAGADDAFYEAQSFNHLTVFARNGVCK